MKKIAIQNKENASMDTWKGLAHIALFTDDLEKTIAFYENLGGKCTMRGEAPKPQWVN